jgi:hypothetical protein
MALQDVRDDVGRTAKQPRLDIADMNNVTLRFLAGFSLALVLTSCANRKFLTDADAIRVADKAATEAGYSLEDYYRIQATRLDENHWLVLYDGKVSPLPDGTMELKLWNHFSVWVNERTEGAQIMRGL